MKTTLGDSSMIMELLESGENKGVVLSWDGSWTSGIYLGALDPTTQTDEHLSHILDGLMPIVASLPAGWIVRFHSFNHGPNTSFDDVQHRIREHGFLLALTHERSNFLKRLGCCKPIQKVITISTPSRRLLPFQRVKNNHDVSELQKLEEQTHRIIQNLGSLGFSPKRLDAPQFYQCLITLGCPMVRFHESRPEWDQEIELKDQMLAARRQEGPSWVWGDVYQRSFCVAKLPREVWPSCIWDIQRVPYPSHLVVTLRALEQEKAFSTLDAAKRRSQELQRLRGKIRGQNVEDDASSEDMISQVSDMISHLAAGDSVCEIAIQAQVFSEHSAGLDPASSVLKDAFSRLGQSILTEEKFRHDEATASMIPGNEALIGDRFDLILTSRATRLLPVFSPQKGSPAPSYLMSTFPNETWGWSSFCPNRVAHNAVVMSSTGSGKSFVVRCLNLPHFMMGGQGIVVTSGSDYNFYAEVIGDSRIIRVDPENESLALNPMVSREAYLRNPDHHLNDITHVILVMSESVSMPIQRRRRLIMHMIGSFYEKSTHVQSPTLADIVNIPCEDFFDDQEDLVAAKSVIRCIKDWLSSPCGKGLLRNRVNTDARMVVYDIEPIGDDIETQRLVLALITSDVNRMIASGQTIVILDECWKILSSETGAYLAANLYRTVRKKGSSVWGISQSVQDWLDLPSGTRQAILTNTSIEIFLRSKPLEAASIAEAFTMNDAEKAILGQLESIQGHYSDMLISIDNKRQIVRLSPTGTELWIATSDKRDVDMRQRYVEMYSHLTTREIAWGLGRKYPHGAPRMEELSSCAA